MATQSETNRAAAESPQDHLQRLRDQAIAGGGAHRAQALHDSGRQTARERIEQLVDPGSWYELGMFAEPELRRPDRATTGDGIVTGLARLDGQRAAIIAIDATVMAGTTAPVNMRKQNRVAEWAGRKGFPVICLSDNDGGRMPDLLGWRFSGVPFDFTTFLQTPCGQPVVPRAAAILGPSFGDAALHAAMGHFVVMQRDASVALSGPPVIQAAIGESVDAADLGGPVVAHETSGSVHLVVDTETEALLSIRRFLSYLPENAALAAPTAPANGPWHDPRTVADLVPADSRRGYDMYKVIDAIVDDGSLFSWGDRFGRSVITALARIEGAVVGVIASQPQQRAGVMDVPALRKSASFVDLCDTFNIPLVFLQDVPGLMIGTDAERAGILAGYEQLVTRLARATVPKVTVIVRKAYGGGHIALGGRPVKPDLLLAWPTAEMGFMAPETGVRTVYRQRLQRVLAEEGQTAHDALVTDVEAEWAAESAPWEAAANLILDAVIDPAETRDAVARGIQYAWPAGPRVTEAGVR